MSKANAIRMFGKYDYDRLVDMDPEGDVKDVNASNPENFEVTQAIRTLINHNKLYLMDKETGIAWPASVVVGFKKNAILIAHER